MKRLIYPERRVTYLEQQTPERRRELAIHAADMRCGPGRAEKAVQLMKQIKRSGHLADVRDEIESIIHGDGPEAV